MYKITKSEQLSKNEYDFWIEAPRIAKKAKPGQFVMLRINEMGERIPLTIADTDDSGGKIRLVFQVIGKTTAELGKLTIGDTILDLTGPLGMPTEIKNYGTVMIVGGGVGIAAVFPIIKGLKKLEIELLQFLVPKQLNL